MNLSLIRNLITDASSQYSGWEVFYCLQRGEIRFGMRNGMSSVIRSSEDSKRILNYIELEYQTLYKELTRNRGRVY